MRLDNLAMHMTKRILWEDRMVALIHKLIQSLLLARRRFNYAFCCEGEQHFENYGHTMRDSSFIWPAVVYAVIYSSDRVIRASARSISYRLVFSIVWRTHVRAVLPSEEKRNEYIRRKAFDRKFLAQIISV